MATSAFLPGDSSKETARIFVGDDPDPLLINLDQICGVPYFANAFRGGFSESESKTITLQDVDKSTVSEFLNWIRAVPPNRIRRGSPRRLEHLVRLTPLVKLWIFADKYRVPVLQNQVMNKIANLYPAYDGQNIPTSLIDYVYTNSQADSPLRRIMVDFAAANMDPGFYSSNVSDLHGEFLEDLCLTMLKLARQAGPGGPIYGVLYYVSENYQDERNPDAVRQRDAGKTTELANLRQTAIPERIAEREILLPGRPRRPKQQREYPSEL